MTHFQGKHDIGQGTKGDFSPPLPPKGRPDLSSLFHGITDAPHIPSGGVPGGSNHPDQPLGSLCALPCVVLHFDIGGEQLVLPLLP